MYTIEDLKQGRCAVINNGTLEELQIVLGLAFPNEWYPHDVISLPTQSVKDFLTKELKRGDLVWVSDNDPNERGDQRISLAKIEGSTYPFVCVSSGEENSFKRGLSFSTVNFKYATKVEEPKEVEMTVEEIEKALNIKNLKIVK